MVKGYKNAIWTGVTTLELANFIQKKIDSNLTGTIHLVNNTSISKYDLICLFNDVFSIKLQVEPYEDYKVDKSLINTRLDLEYDFKSYLDMLKEMKDWIYSNQNLYNHYNKFVS